MVRADSSAVSRGSTMSQKPVIIFTAFEPSGDNHAAPVIRCLARRLPDVPIYAWGGPAMEAAGAKLVASTAVDGAMGLNALKRVREVRSHVRGIRDWSREQRVLVHVAVDSPAANFPVALKLRKQGVRVAHLVAPQLWAWGPWRIRKLRKATDGVLCLLPFEEPWFRERGVPARFVGHPRINRTVDEDAAQERVERLPHGAPRIAIFPGSRAHEVSANINLLVRAFCELRDRHNQAVGVIVLARPELAEIVRAKTKRLPHGVHMTHAEETCDLDGAVTWADLALAVSGTVSLDLTRLTTPMVGVYKTGLFAATVAKIMLRAPYRLLPNIIAEREIVPEFVPHAGGARPIVEAAHELLEDSRNLARQSAELARVCNRYAHKAPDDEAARLIARLAKTGSIDK